ncbi:hypothetical protein [Bowmanella sp. JS7-9]|uniref:Uncharacterized protein n=1 Tax=Pseudobowmanella zhangzhouensis TaxID=1537679 RepID=A0ABW1XHL0_9ALTE|nr:hypothetical protein [Bowmanella sp. JS7-9]TBX21205.1 hypothetical protein TK45_11510 [Bowmanella sp. JS7-9]
MITRIAIGIFVLSLLSALVAKTYSYADLSVYLGVPALVMSGWAALGHLVTLDDDALGEWSNPDRDISIWRHSLMALIVKFLVFIVVGILVYA